MQGRRVSGVVELKQPGDYCVMRSGALWVVLPSGVHGRVDPEDWTITEHEDGTVSVSPSIHDAPDGWHGFLERGVWRSA